MLRTHINTKFNYQYLQSRYIYIDSSSKASSNKLLKKLLYLNITLTFGEKSLVPFITFYTLKP